MAVRVRFVGGCLDGLSDDLAQDEVLDKSPIYIGSWDGASEAPAYDIYTLNPAPDGHGIHTFTCTGQTPSAPDGGEA